MEREQEQRGQLRGEGLGRGDADLGAGVGVERAVGVARDRASTTLQMARTGAPRALRLLERGQRVGRLARLDDGDDQVAGADDRVAVAELAAESTSTGMRASCSIRNLPTRPAC